MWLNVALFAVITNKSVPNTPSGGDPDAPDFRNLLIPNKVLKTVYCSSTKQRLNKVIATANEIMKVSITTTAPFES